MKLTVILVHGIGSNRKDWADEIIPVIQKRLKSKLEKILGKDAPAKIDDVLVISRVYWEGIFKEREAELRKKLDGFPKPVKGGGPWWNRVLRYFWRIFKKFQNEVITDYIGDIVGYLHPPAQRAVYSAISETLKSVKPGDPGKSPLTFIAHSLGTVITSDYIYEQNNSQSRLSGPKIMKDHFILENLFTVGSPIALFSLRFGGPEMFNKPVSVETSQGRWVNIFDEDDPVGMPLKVLNEAYQKVIHKDVLVNSGVYGISHTGYFKRSSKVIDIVCQKLAIDWVAFNKKLSPSEIERLYADYDKTLGVLK